MDAKKHKCIMIGVLIFLLLAGTALISYGVKYMRATKPLRQFSKRIEQGELNEITLTIYYIRSTAVNRIPVSIDAIMKASSDDSIANKIIIDGSRLAEYIDLLHKMSRTTLRPVVKKSYLNARIYYVFASEKEGKIFDVAMFSGKDHSIFVNGIEVKANHIFYDVILPFLLEDSAKELEN